MKKRTLLLLIFSSCLKMVSSQPGALDLSFGSNGIAKTDVGSRFGYEFIGKQMLLNAEGSFHVILQSAGQTFIIKKRPNGSTDSSYGEKGLSGLVALTPIYAALQPDGKIVVGGNRWNGTGDEYDLVRYNTNGSVDKTFNGNGMKSIGFPIASIAIQGDGKIVVAGSHYDNDISNFAIARYNTNGTVDSSFSNDGKQITDFGFSAVQGDPQQYPESNMASSVAIQKDGKIVVLGSAYNYSSASTELAIARYNPDGNLDNSFGGKGKQTVNFGSSENYGYSLAFQSDGKIIAVGYTNLNGSDYDFSIARFNSNGSLDKTFSFDGKQTQRIGSIDLYPNAVAVQGDGKIVVEGYTWNGSHNDFVVTRCNKDGSIDNTFDNDGKVITDFGSTDDYSNSIAIQADGKILVEGYRYKYTNTGTYSDFVVARYNTNGSLDNTFDGDGKLVGSLQQGYTVYTSTAIQKDGKIVATGYSWNGRNNDFTVVRYNTNGSLDNTFSNDGKQTTDLDADDYANSVAIQSDGKIVVAGYSVNSSSHFSIVRYNTNGSLDSTFSGDGRQTTNFGFNDDYANSVVIQADGKIIVAGYSNTGTIKLSDFAIARYNSDGSLDNTFSVDGKQTTDIRSSDDRANSIAMQADGKIVAGGTTWNGNDNDFAVVRYNKDGTLDNLFSSDGKQTTDFGFSDDYASSIAIQKDGKIVAGGRNGDYGNNTIVVARYNTDGKLDPTFSGDGMQSANFGLSDAAATAVTILFNGKVVIAGSLKNNFALARLNTNGSPDVTFANKGIQITEVSPGEDRIQSIAVANNKLYAAGHGQFPGTLGVIARYLIEENKAPAVSITSPVNNASYTAPATVTINATASDADGTISSVKFYNGTTYLATDFTSPYTYTLSTLPAGSYSLTAKATDNYGAQTVSAPVTVKAQNTLISTRPVHNDKQVRNEALRLCLSPNPTINTLQIRTTGLPPNKQLTILVTSVSGSIVKSSQAHSSKKVIQLNVSSLVNGMYTIRVICEDKVMYKQFIKL